MKHFSVLKKDKIDSLAIGVFDGVHLGHKQLLKKLSNNGAVLIIYKEKANITPAYTRSDYIKYPCFYIKFAKIKELGCDDFISFLMNEFPNLKKIIIGYDFKFGANRSCDIFDLKQIFNGKIEVVDEFFLDGVSVHSSIIRKYIENGEIEKANRFLGREYSIRGSIVTGQGLGKKELVPTINLKIEKYLLPKNGVYATRSLVDGKLYNSVTFIGVRKSTDGKFSCETHIIGENIASVKEMQIFFVKFIRENREFTSLDILKEQIKKDIESAQKILSGLA